MPNIKITYHQADGKATKKSDRIIRRRESSAFRECLKPKKTPGRLEFDPNLPKTLTPRGYADYKLKMGMAKKKYESLVEGLQQANQLWEDPDFPANDDSIGMADLKGGIDWLRPKEINPDGDIFKHEASRFDIEQGVLSDCWLLAVISSISTTKSLFYQVIPEDQSINNPGYVGVFRARFWRFGEWVEVLVDDRIPVTKYTSYPCFMHSVNNDEFWSALVEKAYAKLNKCYGHLSGGHQTEAMEDLTGGMSMTYLLTKEKRKSNLKELMHRFAKSCCLMGCTSDQRSDKLPGPRGIINSHAYSINKVVDVKYKGKNTMLVRCRNPWGGKYEWTGPWSDNSHEWDSVSKEEKERIGLVFADDGEFWMSYDDFVDVFTRFEVCHLGLESLDANESINGQKRMDEAIFSGKWEMLVSAGGCINNRNTFWMNPQFRITLTEADKDEKTELCSVYIGLMQKDVRRTVGAGFHIIGFMVYKVPANQSTTLSRNQIQTSSAIVKSRFLATREVTAHFKLPLGNYVIIPSTFKPNEELQFIIRVLTFTSVRTDELDEYSVQTTIPTEVVDSLRVENQALEEDQDMEEAFEKNRDSKHRITAAVLGRILNESSLQDVSGFERLNGQMSRSMLASVDRNLEGQIDKEEFMELWQDLKLWKVIFVNSDDESSGLIQDWQFRLAISQAGFTVSNELFGAIIHRYRDPLDTGVAFSEFLMCMIRLKYAFTTIEAHPKNKMGEALFLPEDYLRFTVCV